jgi:hypothetical protein
MNRSRLTRLEENFRPAESSFRVDPETGWNIIGGGKGSAGVLYTPPISSPDEWLAAGETG